MSVSPEIQQLQDQQALLTQALRAMLEGHWCAEPPSVAAFVAALDPDLVIGCVPPVLESEAPPEPPDYLANYNPDELMPPQLTSWSCSACALSWLLRATGLAATCYTPCGIDAIGYPENINPTYGLMDGSGIELQEVLQTYDQPSSQAWLDFDTAYAIFATTPGMMSGGMWYHWVGVRGVQDGNIWVANSAPGYKGIYDIVTREDFYRLGPFSCVWLVP